MGTTDDLRAVIEAIPTRTLAAKLRPLMPAIELRLQSGVHLREIGDALNQSAALDTNVKLATLKNYLQRYRSRQRAGGRQHVLPASEAARAHPPAPPAAAPPIAVTPSMLRELRNKKIDLESYMQIGRSMAKKKGT